MAFKICACRLSPDRPGDLKEAFNMTPKQEKDTVRQTRCFYIAFPLHNTYVFSPWNCGSLPFSAALLQKWPTEELPEFRELMWELYDDCSALALRLLLLMGVGLQLKVGK